MSFRFKHFSLDDTNTPMKVGIDAVILGAWIEVDSGGQALDVGSGSGIISLMLAQRFQNIDISAIEINQNAFNDCSFNFKNSIWKNRLKVFLGDFTSYQFDNKFDLIVSNPPFFDSDNNNINHGRELSRISKFLPISVLFNKANQILNNKGIVSIIYPYQQREKVLKAALLNGFYLQKELKIRDTKKSEFKRIILVFCKNKFVGNIETEIISLKSNNGDVYSDEFKSLTKEFYL